MHNLNTEDRAQVKAILMTHAEMQDQRTLQTEEVLGRLKHDSDKDDEEAQEMIGDLEDSITDLTTDSENLKRIASQF